MKSRMSREAHVRFCERLVVKFLRPTRPLVKENRALQAVNARLTKKLKNAELIIEVSKKVAALLGQPDPEHPDRRGELMSGRSGVGRKRWSSSRLSCPRCARATLYRHMQPAAARRVRPTPERALDAAELQVVLDHLHSERFRDKAPVEVYATVLDENILSLARYAPCIASLAQNGELKERRNQLRHPQYKKPELLATGPNQVWTWDITKLLGPAKWT